MDQNRTTGDCRRLLVMSVGFARKHYFPEINQIKFNFSFGLVHDFVCLYPGHHIPQSCAHLFDLVFTPNTALGFQCCLSGAILQNEFACKFTALYLFSECVPFQPWSDP